jgi:hypothetical protein
MHWPSGGAIFTTFGTVLNTRTLQPGGGASPPGFFLPRCPEPRDLLSTAGYPWRSTPLSLAEFRRRRRPQAAALRCPARAAGSRWLPPTATSRRARAVGCGLAHPRVFAVEGVTASAAQHVATPTGCLQPTIETTHRAALKTWERWHERSSAPASGPDMCAPRARIPGAELEVREGHRTPSLVSDC